VVAYDPVAQAEAEKHLPKIEYADDEYAAATGADVLVFITEWNQFRALDMERIHKLMRNQTSPTCGISMNLPTCAN
jgi:UDPglucose 6-dehydrogenase